MSGEDGAQAQPGAQAQAAGAAPTPAQVRPVATVTGPKRQPAPPAVLGARTQEIAREVVQQQAQRQAQQPHQQAQPQSQPQAQPQAQQPAAPASQPNRQAQPAQPLSVAQRQAVARQQVYARQQAIARHRAIAEQQAAARQQVTLPPPAAPRVVQQAAPQAVEQAQQQAQAQQRAAAQQQAQAQRQAQAQAQSQRQALARPVPQAPPRRPATPLPVAKTEQIGADTGLPPRTSSTKDALESLPMMRIVWWELALVLGMLAIGRPWPVTAAVGGGGLVVLALSSIRWRGSWLSSLLERRVRLVARRQTLELPVSGDTSAALLTVLAPDATLGTAEIGGVPVGVVGRSGELLTVLRPDATPTPSFAAAALSDWLLPEQDPEMPELKLQLVLHHGPQVGDTARAWVAIRAMREADTAYDEDLRVALSNTVRRMQRRLRQAGLSAKVLPEQEIRATVTALTHTGPGRGTVAEDWRFWRAGSINQVTLRLYGVGNWAGHHRLPALQRMLSAVPSVATTLAVDASETESSAILRIASTTETAVDEAAEHLTRLAPSMGVRLERLDGMHAPAVAASLPIGGTLS